MEQIFSSGNILLFIAIAVWSLPWKGVALWKAARLRHTGWFVVLLVVNTLAILDIIYIFYIVPKAERALGAEKKTQ